MKYLNKECIIILSLELQMTVAEKKQQKFLDTNTIEVIRNPLL